MREWTSNAIEELKNLYVETDAPSDTLIKSKDALSKFTSTLNLRLAAQKDFSSEEVAGELLRIRKSGNLPTIRS